MAHVLSGARADVLVLTGGLGWFPLASLVLAEATGKVPVVEPPDAAAAEPCCSPAGRCAWLRGPTPAGGTARARIRHGLLDEVTVPLPWTEPFARPADGPLVLDEPELTVDIGDQRMTVPLPGLPPGPCLVGVRPGWSGSGALVVRPASGSGDAVVAALGPVTAGGR